MRANDPAPDLAEPSFSVGSVLGGRFILRRPIAAGGSGEVWVATNKATHGIVAIKLVRHASALAAARFRQEASLSAALTHRNVVRVFDYFEDRDHLGLVMECLRGETARERLDRTGPLPARTAVALVTQALAGLSHAHDLNVVHRDLKPPNLFLATDPDGSTTTKILDFGIARTPSNTVHTLHGQLLGTPRYMSPEQIRAESSLDLRSDLFSLGVVLYELLTGRCPFAAPFATASLALVLEKTVEPDPRIPAPLWDVIERALRKDPAERPASAKAFAEALRQAVEATDGVLAMELHRSRPPPPLVLEDVSASIALTESPSAAGNSTLPAPKPRATGLVVLGAALVVAVAAFGAVRALRGHPAPAAAPPIAAAPPPPPSFETPLPSSVPPPPAASEVPPASSVAAAPPTVATAPSAPKHAPSHPTKRSTAHSVPSNVVKDPGF